MMTKIRFIRKKLHSKTTKDNKTAAWFTYLRFGYSKTIWEPKCTELISRRMDNFIGNEVVLNSIQN